MKIAVVANSAWYLFNFRRRLMQALRDDGHDILAISPTDAYAQQLQTDGFEWTEWPLAAAGTNPWRELRAVTDLRRALVRKRVDLAFTYTPKANIYAGLAARGLPLVHVPNVSGLGRAFIQRGLLTRFVTGLYWLAFSRARTVVFQNEDDRSEFLAAGLVDAGRTLRVPGSGVDLERFSPVPLPQGGAPVFLFIGRVLSDKGVREFVQAARQMRQGRPDLIFRILGRVGADNPTAIPPDEVRSWEAEGLIELLGTCDDVRPHLARAHCVVLPSYREGVPRVLLEAAAMARPCIATDVPGCRDAVVDGRSGLLCAPRDGAALAGAMQRFVDAGPAVWASMGAAGRRHVEAHFDEHLVIETYREIARRAAGEAT
ncbi:MAG: glycosyltransferase family 4 protein [Betaproteobacteria bacterium]|nr:glycosyltransferase family 4 protein [Betaproteobacteria bacterium]